jgi:hypothetical protein
LVKAGEIGGRSSLHATRHAGLPADGHSEGWLAAMRRRGSPGIVKAMAGVSEMGGGNGERRERDGRAR